MLNINQNKDFFLNIRSKSSSAIKQPFKPSNQRLNIRPTQFIKETHNQNEFGREAKTNIPIYSQNTLNCPKTIQFRYKESQPSRCSLQIADCSKDFKEFNSKRMKQLIQSVKRTLSIYRNMENNEQTANKNIYSWFNELQQAFLIPSKRQVKIETQQNPYTIHISQIKSSPLEKQNIPSTHSIKQSLIVDKLNLLQVQKLMQQLQCTKKINLQMLQMLNETRQYFTSYRRKYINSQKLCKVLKQEFQSYMDEIDQILEMINTKSTKQGTTTSLQRSIRQILTKLKFKTFDVTIKYQ